MEKDVVRLVRSEQVDGIVLSFDLANKDELESLKSERIPVVQIYRKNTKSTIFTGMQTQSGHERRIDCQTALAERRY